MSASSYLAVYCLLVVLASLLGGWLPSLVELTHRRMQMMVSAVAGLMLGVALLHLLPHAVVHLKSFDSACGWALVGIMAMFFMMRAFHEHQHFAGVAGEAAPPIACTEAHGDAHGHGAHDHHHSPRGISWMGAALGLTLHTLIDGAALAAAVTADQELAGGAALAGLGTFLAVALHKPLDSLSITTLMASEGWSIPLRRRVNLAYAMACPIGAAMFWFGLKHLGDDSSAVVGSALAFAAGVFVCIALADLLPEIEFHTHDRAKLSAALLAGVALAYAIGFVEPAHSHEGETDGHGEHAHMHGSHEPSHSHADERR